MNEKAHPNVSIRVSHISLRGLGRTTPAGTDTILADNTNALDIYSNARGDRRGKRIAHCHHIHFNSHRHFYKFANELCLPYIHRIDYVDRQSERSCHLHQSIGLQHQC